MAKTKYTNPRLVDLQEALYRTIQNRKDLKADRKQIREVNRTTELVLLKLVGPALNLFIQEYLCTASNKTRIASLNRLIASEKTAINSIRKSIRFLKNVGWKHPREEEAEE